MPEEMTYIVDAGTTKDMPLRMCPECKQTGRGYRCHHYDITGERTVPTVPVAPPSFQARSEEDTNG